MLRFLLVKLGLLKSCAIGVFAIQLMLYIVLFLSHRIDVYLDSGLIQHYLKSPTSYYQVIVGEGTQVSDGASLLKRICNLCFIYQAQNSV